ncbi:hypothetical protein JM79_2132 [Gramella sp. Hel_I_59]|uniref:hypothetical protein n=1 Tax=Gramella sp. Hel_I_59 TaxID=1249978 RepID=UPI00114F719C|nr:hypothetical protein [Gramella sp. Hel_I_59]TQI71205.1 hypothetical protein JM79_2132 [Gramella sp. Hel_I_59]
MNKLLQIILISAILLITTNCKNGSEDKILSAVSAKEEKGCNYIEEYYQTVYQAEIAYLRKEYQKSFDLLKKAESRCELLNQPPIYEIKILAELYVRLEKPEGAFPYLYSLLKKGDSFSSIENNQLFEELKATPKWKKLEKEAPELEKEFQAGINMEIRKEILAMIAEDQRVRRVRNVELWEEIDSVNQKRLKEIFNQYGYPNSNIVGHGYFQEQPDITVLLMHFDDTIWFKPRLIDYIRKGEAPTDVLAAMIDSRKRGTDEYTYGIYSSADSTNIKDFQELDSRRLKVGLRPYKMQKEYRKLKDL